MKNFARHIKYLIRRNNKVVIPGFGALLTVDIPAFISEKGEIIIPPTRTLYFEEDIKTDSDQLLISSYARHLNIEQAKAETLTISKVDEFKNQLLRHGMFIMGTLGNFFQKEGKIEFQSNRNSSAYNPWHLFDQKENQANKEITYPTRSFGKIATKIVSTTVLLITSAAAMIV